MDRLSRRIDPVGAAETLAYDANGNLVNATDRKGQMTTFTYDPLNRRTRATHADGSIATYTYDAAGRLVQADDTADPHRPITLAYDGLDRLVAETTGMGTVTYEYDVLGRRTQMRVNDLNPVTYTYDAASQLRSIVQPPLNPVTIDYDVVGRRTKLTLPNAVSTEYQYDAASRLTALIYRNATGLLGDLAYSYDASGYRAGVGGSFARTLLPDPVASTTYDAANRQRAFGDKTMNFDANGNLTSLIEPTGTTTFIWDARNRLSAVNAPGFTANFAYDQTGRRAQKTVNAVTTQFQYDRGNLVRELVEDREVRYLHSLRLDETLCRLEAEGASYYLADSLSSTVALTSASGMPTTTYTYEPFGRSIAAGTPNSNAFRFTGRELEPSGFYYYRARYYAPTLARFLAEDPIRIMGGSPNYYAYVNNGPLNFTDPTGMLLLDCTRPVQQQPLGALGALHRFIWRDGRTYGFCSQGQDTSFFSIFRTLPGGSCPAEAPEVRQLASTSCQEVITDQATEQCVEKVGQDLMSDTNPPGYNLRTHNCQDWATEAFRRCGLNRPFQQVRPIFRQPLLTEAAITP
jgi:RHS repeat-associated protein